MRSSAPFPASLVLAPLLVLFLGTHSALGQEPPAPADPPERIALAVERLEAAWKQPELEALLTVLREESRVAAPEVVKQIKRGLTDKRPEVRDLAITVLGTMRVPSALDALRYYAKRNRRKIEDDVELHERVIRAIGLHADPKDLDWFADRIFAKQNAAGDGQQRRIIKARIYAMGQLRTRESVEKLMSLMRSNDVRRTQPNMRDFRVSLMLLTGEDFGTDSQRWAEWWNDNRKKFEVAKKAPVLPQEERTRWESFWGYGRTYDRARRRGDRGGD